MSINLKYTVTLTLCGGILLAFVLLTDLYPFMRTGMFAEPVRSTQQTEQFMVSYTTETGDSLRFDPQQIGLTGSRINYLSRSYYYRGKGEQLLQKIQESYPDAVTLRLHRIETITRHQTDTSVVATYATKR